MKRIWLILSIMASSVFAQQSQIAIGLRLSYQTVSGDAADELQAIGLYTDSPLKGNWTLRCAMDYIYDFTFERPWEIAGIQQDTSVPPLDSDGTMAISSISLENQFKRNARGFWQGGFGVGYGIAETDEITGPRQGGGTFHIRTQSKDAIILAGNLAYTGKINKRWSWEASINIAHHLTEWIVRDLNSSASGTIHDFTAAGLSLGFKVKI
ncbi:MAG: hypothetical protein KDC35_16585 [Acidobacteria bacterium]|nr:hypothetical protein [Acidobacteriota bacterium]